MQHKLLLGACLSLSVLGAYAQPFEWGGRFGGIGEDVVRDLFVDPAGNSYTTGYFTDSADFSVSGTPYVLTSNGFYDVFVQKTGPDGNLIWARSFGSESFEYGTGITADALGNVYVTGVFDAPTDFDPGAGDSIVTSNGGQDIFLVKLDSDGNFLWAGNVGGPDYDESTAVGTDGSGNVYLSGYFNATADFEPGNGTFEMTGAGMNDNFAAKFSPNGALTWARQYGSADFEAAISMKVTAGGEQYITGFYNGTADFDPGTDTFEMTATPNNNTGFLLKLDTDGNFQLARNFASTGSVLSYDVDLDAAGNIYLAGNFSGTVDLDPGTGTLELTADQVNGFVLKLDAAADFAWGKIIESSEAVIPYSVDVNALGYVMTSGFIETTTDFDPDTVAVFELGLSSGNAMGAFVSILDNNGVFVHALEFGGCNIADYHGAYTDAANNIYISGAFETTIDLNADPVLTEEVQAMDFRDNYLIRLEPAYASVPSADYPQLSLFPNPVTDNAVLNVSGSNDEAYAVYDPAGRRLLTGKLESGSASLNVSGLSQGVYVLHLSGGRTLEFVKH
jgi:hypothetical protein